ncbi:MAG: hypothetical protein HZC41_24190 [Chloroflexi bacterium]|nr:hypothetical protein [Chloroflexota bacterium]
MSQQQFYAAKELINQKRYDEARALLKTINHPAAKDWLRNLDKIQSENTSIFSSALPRYSIFFSCGSLLVFCILIVFLWLVFGNTGFKEVRYETTTPTQPKLVALGLVSTPVPTRVGTSTSTPTPTITDTPTPSNTPLPTVDTIATQQQATHAALTATLKAETAITLTSQARSTVLAELGVTQTAVTIRNTQMAIALQQQPTAVPAIMQSSPNQASIQPSSQQYNQSGQSSCKEDVEWWFAFEGTITVDFMNARSAAYDILYYAEFYGMSLDGLGTALGTMDAAIIILRDMQMPACLAEYRTLMVSGMNRTVAAFDNYLDGIIDDNTFLNEMGAAADTINQANNILYIILDGN